MHPNRIIITDRVEVAKAIRQAVPDQVLEVHPQFIDLAAPGFNSEFEPQFRTMNPKAEKMVRALRGEVICALPPTLSGTANILLYNVAATLQNRPATVLYAPLHSLQPEAIQTALDQAAAPDAWYITSMIARRLTERLIGIKVMPILKKAELPYNGWASLYCLYEVAALSKPSWLRCIKPNPPKTFPASTNVLDNYRAYEIDPYGGTVYHSSKPKSLANEGGKYTEFSVEEHTVDAMYPDQRYRLNQMLTGVTDSLVDVHAELENAYMSGLCSWPFTYGGIPYGQIEFQVFQPTGILTRLPKGVPASKVITLFEKEKTLFRSVSHYPLDPQIPTVNEIPHLPLQTDVEKLEPANTLDALLQRFTSRQLNIDLSALLKPMMIDYITQQGQTIELTPKGLKVLECLQNMGLSHRVFYLLLRVLENIQTNESSYNDVMHQIADALDYKFEANK